MAVLALQQHKVNSRQIPRLVVQEPRQLHIRCHLLWVLAIGAKLQHPKVSDSQQPTCNALVLTFKTHLCNKSATGRTTLQPVVSMKAEEKENKLSTPSRHEEGKSFASAKDNDGVKEYKMNKAEY